MDASIVLRYGFFQKERATIASSDRFTDLTVRTLL